MKRRFRLTRSTDLQRVRRFGKTYAHPLVLLAALPSELATVRTGFVAGAVIGGAVVRNTVKRRMRACMDEFLSKISPGWDLVLTARKPIGQADYSLVRTAILNVLYQGGLLERD